MLAENESLASSQKRTLASDPSWRFHRNCHTTRELCRLRSKPQARLNRPAL